MIAHFRTTFKKKEKIEMNDSIIRAYTSFNQLLSDDTNRDIFFKENFYVMETPEGIKGYTNRYLLIILNCNGLQLNGLTFDASKNKFTPADGVTVDENYVKNISAIVKNKIKYSKYVLQNDYYGTVFGKK